MGMLKHFLKQAVMSNTLIDNIFLADKKRTRQDWIDGIAELMHQIRAMDTNDLNEWITWFSNVIRKLNEDERGELITQIKEGDEKDMCSLFERLLNKEKTEGKAESVIELLEDLEELPDSLKTCIMEQTDTKLLRKWLKVAAKATFIDEFEQAIGLVQVYQLPMYIKMNYKRGISLL
ncbi:hypothetical protein C804_06568 [Lachnospiraceae bacterium A4]|nr:hypothetical protein C804_06568 [Lachnospiraceae bacterium A4]